MLRGVNAVQERLQEHLRERAACSRAALFWSTAVCTVPVPYCTVRSAAAGVIWQPIEALELVELGSHDLKSSSLVGAASDGETATGKTRLVKVVWLARTECGVT